MTADYKSTVFLPKTAFSMKAGLPALEPKLLERWDRMELFKRLRAESKGREKFILHDGPPYANGNIHIGTALNKILKDVVNRSQQMLGKNANWVLGWDCHGLPIEWKVEEQYRAQGKKKEDVPVADRLRDCRAFAEHWIQVQWQEFRRLGVEADWPGRYMTMRFSSEAQIYREFTKFLMCGNLYRGARPVLWSVPERTTLADAEVEYHDHRSTSIYVPFPVVSAAQPALAGASVVIWTTTPWTIPGNRAIAYGDKLGYVLVEVKGVAEGSGAKPGDRFVVAGGLLAPFAAAAKIAEHATLAEMPGADLAGTVCHHPLHGQGYDFPVPLLPGDFVTLDAGTGFVHIAPGHGTDDYQLGLAHGLPQPETVGEDGAYLPHVPLFAGARVLDDKGKTGDADGKVIGALAAAGRLLGKAALVHSYPHSWRSKAPLIFRNTPQWFIAMDRPGAVGTATLRETALAAIDATRFVPGIGKNRLRSMIEQRPDWTVSRQRVWGVPLAVFVDRQSGEPLRDEAVNERIAAAFEQEGGSAWFTGDPRRFLSPEHDPARYTPVMDVIEVWFDSGSSHSFVLEPRKDDDLAWPASLYLEGSDQHRGWFHTSLLEACGTRGRPPFEAVLTHGFVLDEQGRKMSKSLGNVVAPQKVIDESGADILRLWVVSSDYSEDLRIGKEILKQQVDTYRRLRNTLRYLLGALEGYSAAERMPEAELPELERYMLHRLWELDGLLRQCCADFEFHKFYAALHNFCAVELSAFYFDIRKDSLYCDPASAARRRAARTLFDTLFSCLTAWLAPALCFTAEEAWLARHGSEPQGVEESVHLRTFPAIPAAWRDDALAEKWTRLRAIRRVVTGALERERAEKRIGASLEAAPTVHLAAADFALATTVDFAELCITSDLTLSDEPAPDDAFTLPDVAGVAVVPAKAGGDKCARCWQVLPEVGTVAAHPALCVRCADAVGDLPAVAA